MLKGKKIVIGVSGGIAAYKACEVVRGLKKLGAEVDVVMTTHAAQFVTPLTFGTLADSVCCEMFDGVVHGEVRHIALAKKADLFLVCPATANIIGKIACGIADDMLSTTLLATKAQVLLCPSMNVNMYHNGFFRENLQKLMDSGMKVVEGDSGFLACGDHGEGRLAEPQKIVDACISLLTAKKDLADKKVLVTCGATLEKLDDVRFVTNFSSGKMGAALVRRALDRGAEVTVVAARHSVPLDGRAKVVDVSTTQQMLESVMALLPEQDVVVMAAAPCDYKPKVFSETKIKSERLVVEFEKNPDVAQAVGQAKGNRFLCIFAAETDNGLANARQKLVKKHADLAVLNDVKHNNVFGSDTDVVTLVDSDGQREYPEMSKEQVADLIFDRAVGK